jgi:hypothetical protein
MALQIEYTSPDYGLYAPAAYAKIETFRGNINEVHFTVLFYATAQARFEGKNPIGGFHFSMPYQDGMTYTSVYNHLKTLPEFANSLDV